MHTYDVTALGELLVDFTADGTRSRLGNLLFEANPGGAPCNVLSMLQKLGRRTAFIGKVGDDAFGDMLIDALRVQGVCTDGLRIDRSAPTALAFVRTGPDGDRRFSFYGNPAADRLLRADEVDSALLENSAIFHFGSLSMAAPACEAATRAAIETAGRAGALLSFDPNLRPALWRDTNTAKEKIRYGLSRCQILKIADDELAFLTGSSDIDAGISWLRERYAIPLVCVTMGARGSRAYSGGLAVSCDAFPNPQTVDTTGAGDTFMACVLDAVLENGLDGFDGEKLYGMLAFANAAASIVTARRGALQVMPEKAEVLRFLAEREREI